jgi:hypothetical protein
MLPESSATTTNGSTEEAYEKLQQLMQLQQQEASCFFLGLQLATR